MKRALVLSFVALAIGVAWAPGTAIAATAAPVPVEQYVNSVCTSISTFGDATSQASQTFQDNSATLTKVPQVKQEFVAFFDSLHDAVTQLQADLDAAGTPQLDHGTKIAKQLQTGIASVESVVADARDAAADLATSNPSQFAKSATKLGKKLDKAFSGIDGFEDLPKKYDTSALKTAQEADPDCALLNS